MTDLPMKGSVEYRTSNKCVHIESVSLQLVDTNKSDMMVLHG